MERRDIGDDIRRLLAQLDDHAFGGGTAGQCSPPCDVVETPEAIEVVMDVPGIAADSVKVLVARQMLVIAGQKLPAACTHREAAFHLAERTFGRFVRTVRLGGAIDTGRAYARMSAGELRVTLPRIEERRGRETRIPIRAE